MQVSVCPHLSSWVQLIIAGAWLLVLIVAYVMFHDKEE